MIGYQFGAVGVSDGISMGTPGMSYSLQSRDLIADQVETAAGGHWLDGLVVIPGCDKNMPGVLMARTLKKILSRTLYSQEFQSADSTVRVSCFMVARSNLVQVHVEAHPNLTLCRPSSLTGNTCKTASQ